MAYRGDDNSEYAQSLISSLHRSSVPQEVITQSLVMFEFGDISDHYVALLALALRKHIPTSSFPARRHSHPPQEIEAPVPEETPPKEL